MGNLHSLSMVEGLDEEERINSDPFNFTGSEERPQLVSNINWSKAYDWAPRLFEIRTDTERPSFRGRKSDIAQGILHHLGRPLRLDNHAFMLPIYNADYTHAVLKCSRQVAKSTTICKDRKSVV